MMRLARRSTNGFVMAILIMSLIGGAAAAAAEQQGAHSIVPARRVQGRVIHLPAVHIRTRVEQGLDDRHAAILAGSPQRGGPEIVCRVHIGARIEQEPNGVDIVVVARPVQGRGTVPLGRIHARALVEQRPHRCPLTLLGRINEARRLRLDDARVTEAENQHGNNQPEGGAALLSLLTSAF